MNHTYVTFSPNFYLISIYNYFDKLQLHLALFD